MQPIDFSNEEDLKHLLKGACPSVEASPVFKSRLSYQLSAGARENAGYYRPLFARPAFWFGVCVVFAASFIFCGFLSSGIEERKISTSAAYMDDSLVPPSEPLPPPINFHPDNIDAFDNSHSG